MQSSFANTPASWNPEGFAEPVPASTNGWAPPNQHNNQSTNDVLFLNNTVSNNESHTSPSPNPFESHSESHTDLDSFLESPPPIKEGGSEISESTTPLSQPSPASSVQSEQNEILNSHFNFSDMVSQVQSRFRTIKQDTDIVQSITYEILKAAILNLNDKSYRTEFDQVRMNILRREKQDVFMWLIDNGFEVNLRATANGLYIMTVTWN